MSTRKAQQGVILFIAMIVLVVMALAGIAMMRQVGTGGLIAGNMAFKQNATSVGDLGFETARNWITTTVASLDNDGAANGYFSSWDTAFDPNTYAWKSPATNSTQVTADDGFQNEVRYVIHRMCNTANAAVSDPAQKCVTVKTVTGGSTHGDVAYGQQPLPNAAQPYFRITIAIFGPRNTTSYVQAMMY